MIEGEGRRSNPLALGSMEMIAVNISAAWGKPSVGIRPSGNQSLKVWHSIFLMPAVLEPCRVIPPCKVKVMEKHCDEKKPRIKTIFMD